MMTYLNRLSSYGSSLLLLSLLMLGLFACQTNGDQRSDEQAAAEENMKTYQEQIDEMERATAVQDEGFDLDYFRHEVNETRRMIENDWENYNEEAQAAIAEMDQRWADALARWEARVVDTDYFRIRQNIELYLAEVRDSVEEGKVQQWDPLQDRFEEEVQRMEAAADSVSVTTLNDDRQALQGRLEMIYERWKEKNTDA